MEKIKYAELTAKVIEADKKLDAAIMEAFHTIRETVTGVSLQEFSEWAEMASEDDRVSPQIFHLACMVAEKEKLKDIATIMAKLKNL